MSRQVADFACALFMSYNHPMCQVTCLLAILGAAYDTTVEEATTSGRCVATDGGGSSDFLVKHQIRVNKVYRWLAKSQTRWQLAVLFVCVKIIDGLVYFILGGQDGDEKKRPGTRPHAGAPIDLRQVAERVAVACNELYKVLRDLEDPHSKLRRLLAVHSSIGCGGRAPACTWDPVCACGWHGEATRASGCAA